MKKLLALIFFVLFLTSFISATVVVNPDIKDTYNIGDTIKVPIKITTTTDLHNVKASMQLICNGIETEVYSEYFTLEAGDEEQRTPSIPLIQELLGRTTGTCKIKVSLGEEEPVLSKEFDISDKVTITPKIEKTEFSPGETVVIEGDAVKENGKAVQGFVEVTASIANSSSNIDVTDTVKNGFFHIEIPLEDTTKAGEYNVNINVYEQNDAGEKTNHGYASASFNILQIPTSLEIVFENNQVEPGTSVKAKTILHDQTGDPIDSISIATIKNQADDILEQKELSPDEYLEYAIPYNQPPANWTVVAISNKLNAQAPFAITEKKDVDIELLNETLKITNQGNVPYNDSVLVKIGEENLYLNVTLGIDESKEFTLTAPEGEYQISIMADGEDTVTQNVLLTGHSIDIKEGTGGMTNLMQHPFVWIFMIGIFGFIAFVLVREKTPARMIAYIKSKKKPKNDLVEHKKKFNSLLNFKKNKEKKLIDNYENKAELSLSIKGTKQNTNIVCLKVKNFEHLDTSKIQETMQKIIMSSIEKKAMIYENQDNVFFLFAPSKTRTFKNEKPALELAQQIKKILTDHNKLFKQKIDFGISVNQGEIVAAMDKSKFIFMSLGAIITSAKKIASASDKEILLDEKTKNKLTTSLKVEKINVGNITAYSIKEIKKLGDNKKFLENFVERMKNEKK